MNMSPQVQEVEGNQDPPTSKSMKFLYTQGTMAGRRWTVGQRPSSQRRQAEVGAGEPPGRMLESLEGQRLRTAIQEGD